jgi:hypothetical protein
MDLLQVWSYTHEYDEILTDAPIEIQDRDETSDYQAVLIGPSMDKSVLASIQAGLDFDLKLVIKNVLSDFGGMDLNEMLDYVYFETEPMLNASSRGEHLDFSKCQSSSDRKVRKLEPDRKKLSSLKQKYKERISNATSL